MIYRHRPFSNPEPMPTDSAKERADQSPKLLRKWASLGADLVARRSRRVPTWDAATRLIEAAHPKLQADAKRLQTLLAESRRLLFPLEDPFDLDLGLHRWLEADREEAYSDWLEWVVRQANRADRVFKLFGLEFPAELPASQLVTVKRECCIPYGHIEQEGRLDLVIRLDPHAIIVVEIKKGDAEESDTAKQAGYKQWLDEQHQYPKGQRYSIFLAASANEEEYEQFKPLLWETVCIQMRRLAIELKQKQVAIAAMTLAFVAAVEQNLLGYSAPVIRRVCEAGTLRFNPRVVDYIGRFLGKEEV
jgi:hypothetical protein